MTEDFEIGGEELVELREFFFAQATETIDSLGELILRVERDPADVESLRAIRRAVHTLKGDSTAFGFSELTDLAHRYEDALDRLHARAGAASRELIDLLLAGSDALAAFISYYRGEGERPDVSQLVAGLAALNKTDEDAAPAQPPAKKSKSRGRAAKAVEEPPSQAAESVSVAESSINGAPPLPAEKPTEKAPVTVASDAPAEEPAEAVCDTGERGEDFRPGERRSGLDRRQGDRRQSQTTFLRVESERIDAAMNLVGELMIQRSMIVTLASEIEAERRGDETARRLSEAVALSSRTLSELQESVMRMRLVPIDQVFKRFPRVVRDAGLKLGKPIRLEIEGGQTEIDKSVVEVISDPLIHLIRNSCDHGIEPPEVRAAVGKPVEGLIRLSARRAGNQIAVEVSDDGSGIDPNRVLRKAIEKGLVNATETADWTDQQKIGLIFLPGFSTKEEVSDMSGRGVGMDVVKTTVDSLGGSMSVSSAISQGSRFTIKLPLTMAIVRAMLFETAGRNFALPLDSIREITRLRADEQRTIDGREVLRLRNRVLPLVRVDEALGLRTPSERAPAARLFVFVVDLGDGRDVGLAVEKLYGEQELVLKTVDDRLSQSNVIAGASILGDGGVVLILDAPALIAQVAARGLARAGARVSPGSGAATDDGQGTKKIFEGNRA